MSKQIEVTSLHQLAAHEFMYMTGLTMINIKDHLSNDDKKNIMKRGLKVIKSGISLGVKGLTTPDSENAQAKVPVMIKGHKTNFLGITDPSNKSLINIAVRRRHYFLRIVSDIESDDSFQDKIKLLIQDYVYIFYDCAEDSKTKHKFMPLNKDKKYTIGKIIQEFANMYDPKHHLIVLDITEALIRKNSSAIAVVTYISKKQFNPLHDVKNEIQK